MADDLQALLDGGDVSGAAAAVMLGLALSVFVALLWLRLIRWALGLFGVRA